MKAVRERKKQTIFQCFKCQQRKKNFPLSASKTLAQPRKPINSSTALLVEATKPSFYTSFFDKSASFFEVFGFVLPKSSLLRSALGSY